MQGGPLIKLVRSVHVLEAQARQREQKLRRCFATNLACRHKTGFVIRVGLEKVISMHCTHLEEPHIAKCGQQDGDTSAINDHVRHHAVSFHTVQHHIW